MENDLEKKLRDPESLWYGPHQCEACGGIVIRQSLEQGGLKLDAEDHNHHYPNFLWQEHQCKPSIHSLGGKARSASLTPQERSEIAREAANQRWLEKKYSDDPKTYEKEVQHSTTPTAD